MAAKPSALTTHVLDTARGVPAAGMRVELWRMDGPAPVLVREALTNADGRTDAPLMDAVSFLPGTYELRFHLGDYFAEAAPRFLDVVTLRVGLAAGQGHYHVPLLCSPWSYATYRGS